MDDQKQLKKEKIKLNVSNDLSLEAVEAKASRRSLSRLPEPDKFGPNYFVGAFALTLFISLMTLSINSPRAECGVWWCSLFLVLGIFIVIDIDVSTKTLRTVRLAQQRRYGLVFLIMFTAFLLSVLLSEMVLLVRPCDLRIFIVAACLMGGWDNIRQKQIANPEHPLIQETPRVQD